MTTMMKVLLCTKKGSSFLYYLSQSLVTCHCVIYSDPYLTAWNGYSSNIQDIFIPCLTFVPKKTNQSSYSTSHLCKKNTCPNNFTAVLSHYIPSEQWHQTNYISSLYVDHKYEYAIKIW